MLLGRGLSGRCRLLCGALCLTGLLLLLLLLSDLRGLLLLPALGSLLLGPGALLLCTLLPLCRGLALRPASLLLRRALLLGDLTRLLLALGCLPFGTGPLLLLPRRALLPLG